MVKPFRSIFLLKLVDVAFNLYLQALNLNRLYLRSKDETDDCSFVVLVDMLLVNMLYLYLISFSALVSSSMFPLPFFFLTWL